MPPKHENQKPNIPRLQFSPEQVVTDDDPEFFDELERFLEAHGYSPADLLYSGFDGEPLVRGREVPRYDFVFAMNRAGWLEALRTGQENPATYAFGISKNPVLALYDRTQIATARPHGAERVKFNEEEFNFNDRLEFDSVEKLENLVDLPEGTIVEETIVHKDFPEASPTDALIGLVFLEQFQPERKRKDRPPTQF